MTASIGFHLNGNKVFWAKVNQTDNSTPQIIDAGECHIKQLPKQYKLLCGNSKLPWACSYCEDNIRPHQFPKRWPLRDSGGASIIHPAVAAATWDWECGKLQDGDLHLYLGEDLVCCSDTTPGDSFHLSLERDKPLNALIEEILELQPRPPRAICLCGNNLSKEVDDVAIQLEQKDLKVFRLQDSEPHLLFHRAALGAAIFARDLTRRGGLRVTSKSKIDFIWLGLTLMCLLANGVAYSTNKAQAKLELEQASNVEAPKKSQNSVRVMGELPLQVERILRRRRASIDALDNILKAASKNSLEQIQITTGPLSREVKIRIKTNTPGSINQSKLSENINLTASQTDDLVLLGRAINQEPIK